MKIKKILLSISLGALLFSCANTGNLVELSKPVIEHTESIIKKSNNEILASDTYSKTVFDRTKRKVNRNMKGIWVATVFNLDFPKTRGEYSQKREIEEIVRNAKDWGYNAIFFQVKPEAGVFYNSKVLPWSKYLNGVEDQNPGYDPLEYFIKTAHEYGLELHAWINPYRLSMSPNLKDASYRNIGLMHPEWAFIYDNKLFLNPSEKKVVEYLYNTIEEIVTNYDVDGVHLDDYFYPYPNSDSNIRLSNNFDQSYYDIEKDKHSDIGDFRREQVNSLIKNLSVSIHKIKPNVSFGIAPFGIWRNKSSDYRGSNTSGLESYDTLYADTLKWMSEKWIDYVAPQIYWKIDNPVAGYKTLVEWWNEKARETNTPLYIGEGPYKLTEEVEKWNWPTNEMQNHSYIRRSQSNVDGYIMFRYGTLKNNPWLIEAVK